MKDYSKDRTAKKIFLAILIMGLFFIFIIPIDSLLTIEIHNTKEYQSNSVSKNKHELVNPIIDNSENVNNYTKIANFGRDVIYTENTDFCVNDDLIFIAQYDLFIYNISNPVLPKLIYKYISPWGQILEVETHDDLVYMICKRMGLLVLNVSNPTKPEELGKCGGFDGLVKNEISEEIIDGAIENNTAYIIVSGRKVGDYSGWEGYFGVYFIDFSDPIYPKPIGFYDDEIFSRMIISDGFCYALTNNYKENNQGYLTVIDFRDLTNPTVVTSFPIDTETSQYYCCAKVFEISNNYLFVGSEFKNKLGIFNITNPFEIKKVGVLPEGSYEPVAIIQDYIIKSSYFSVKIYSVENPNNPQLINEYPSDLYELVISAHLFNDTLVLVSKTHTKFMLKIYNATDFSNLISLAKLDIGSFCCFETMAMENDIAYCYSFNGLEIYNCSNYSNITRLGEFKRRLWRDFRCDEEYDFYEYRYQLFVENNITYVFDEDTLLIINCSDLSAPKIITTFNTSGYYEYGRVTIEDNYLYLMNGSTLEIYNLTNPSNITLVSGKNLGFNYEFRKYEDLICFVSFPDATKVYFLNVSNKMNPELITELDLNFERYRGFEFSNNLVFLIVSYDELIIIDANNPLAPFVSSNTSIYSPWMNCLTVSENKCFFVNYNYIQILDCVDPANPVESGRFYPSSEYFFRERKWNSDYYYSNDELIIRKFTAIDDTIIIPKGQFGFDIIGPDNDNDLLSNYYEEKIYDTNINESDSDLDGASDYFEVSWGLDPLNSSDGSLDNDLDGLNNVIESYYGTNPFDDDTDRDGLNDTYEIDLSTNPLYFDTEKDGLSDGVEVLIFGTNPFKFDTDNDDKNDFYEIAIGSNPLAWNRWKLVFLGYCFPVYSLLIITSPFIVVRIRKYVKKLIQKKSKETED